MTLLSSKPYKSKIPTMAQSPSIIWPLHFLSDLIMSYLSGPCSLSSRHTGLPDAPYAQQAHFWGESFVPAASLTPDICNG